ncbi:MAG: amidohydrolase [Saprospiraceae bacterium]|nr:amidohydrolase [Saprospiraceae bacterium]
MSNHFLSLAIFFLLGTSVSAQTLPPSERSLLTGIYQHLHAHPELSLHETETSAFLCRELDKLGLTYRHPIGGQGIAGLLENGDGPTILLRTDMDALPLAEKTGASFASRVVVEKEGSPTGVMHACGHDLHMTVWLGTLRYLATHQDTWKGRILFVAQSAEETGQGAKLMLEDGLYDLFPRPDLALAWHTSADLPSHTIGICSGWAMANVDMLTILVRGVGGHGASPHLTVDPVVTAAKIVVDLQTIVSREESPFDPAVITVGAIHGGTVGNIIPDEVRLELTVRSFGDEQRASLVKAIERTCWGTAIASGVPDSLLPVVTVRDMFTPALYNDPALTLRSRHILDAYLGADHVLDIKPQTIGEDFSQYGRQEPPIPSLMLRLGTASLEQYQAREGQPLPGLHSPYYLPDAEHAIPLGVEAMSHLIGQLTMTR